MKTPEQHKWYYSGAFIVNFEQISHLFLVFLLFTLNKYMFAANYVLFSKNFICIEKVEEDRLKNNLTELENWWKRKNT